MHCMQPALHAYQVHLLAALAGLPGTRYTTGTNPTPTPHSAPQPRPRAAAPHVWTCACAVLQDKQAREHPHPPPPQHSRKPRAQAHAPREHSLATHKQPTASLGKEQGGKPSRPGPAILPELQGPCGGTRYEVRGGGAHTAEWLAGCRWVGALAPCCAEGGWTGMPFPGAFRPPGLLSSSSFPSCPASSLARMPSVARAPTALALPRGSS